MIVPALLLGLSFPLLLNLYVREMGDAGASVGRVYAANTVGAVLGSIVAGFVLLPTIGSLDSIRAAATVNCLLAALFAILLIPKHRARTITFACAVLPLIGLLWLFPRGWNIRRMTVGSYVYFGAADKIDRVLYAREDSQGGLTSVVQVGAERVMLSNGKFQGGDKGEVPAQIRFALTPLLFTRQFGNALVIGLGTGNTLRALSRLPFQRIDVAELAPAVVDAARLWFRDVNGGVLDSDPRVHLSIADGRNFLLLSQEDYDLITVELTSIWISGEADLYNREFYELCRARLRQRGVLQQWVQIHHMRLQDFLLILNTAARVFPYVAFFQGPEQGLLVASASPLELDYDQIQAFDRTPEVRSELTAAGVPSMASLAGELMLYGASLQHALSRLPALSGHSGDFVSTDFSPYLEYLTPKANVLPYDTASEIRGFLKEYRPAGLPPEMTIVNLRSKADQDLMLGYFLEQRGEDREAAVRFKNVTGPAKAQAQIEIARIGAMSSVASP
jgi:spermidine synthase